MMPIGNILETVFKEISEKYGRKKTEQVNLGRNLFLVTELDEKVCFPGGAVGLEMRNDDEPSQLALWRFFNNLVQKKFSFSDKDCCLLQILAGWIQGEYWDLPGQYGNPKVKVKFPNNDICLSLGNSYFNLILEILGRTQKLTLEYKEEHKSLC